MKGILAIGLSLLMVSSVFAENCLLNGGQSSRVDYKMVQKVERLRQAPETWC